MSISIQYSIKERINKALLSTGLFVLGSTCFLFTVYELITFKQSLTSEVSSLAQVMSMNSAAPLVFSDKRGAEELLQTLKVKPRICGARLYDTNGSIFVSFEPDESSKENLLPEKPGPFGDQLRNLHIYFFQPVYQGKEFLGTLLIVSDLNGIFQRVEYYALIVAIIIVIALIATYRMSTSLNENVSHPILNLANTMLEVSKRNDYSVRAQVKNKDELGFLVERFNHMLGQIQISDQELKQSRESLEERVLERTEELEKSRTIAEEANQSKSEFLTRMSHELRTPLNAVIGFGQLLETNLRTTIDDLNLQNLSRIVAAGQHLLALINDILDLSKVDSGHMYFSIEDIQLSGLVQEVVELMESFAEEMGVELNIDQDSFEDVFVYADQVRLRQVLLNLISNAIKYNKTEGAVNIECSQVTDEMVRIDVSDTGMGISEKRLSELFEPFNRLDVEWTGIEGTGIGLALAKKLVYLMEGKIEVETEEGKGSCFSVTLPKGKPSHELVSTTLNEKSCGAQRKSSDTLRVLYIEDNLANLSLVEQVLAFIPRIKLFTARDGLQGVEAAIEHNPDLILLDMNLPGLGGRDVFKQLKTMDSFKAVPVVAISAEAMESEIQKTLELGFEAYLTKPINLDDFQKTIRHYIS